MTDQVCDNHDLMKQFWPKQKSKIDSLDLSDYREINKHQELPIARIKKIMKIDEDVKGQMISSEAPVMLAKACELIIEEMTTRSWIHTTANRRKTIQKSDVVTAISRCEMFDFLVDIMPRDDAKAQNNENNDADASEDDSASSTPQPSVTSNQQQHKHPQQFKQIVIQGNNGGPAEMHLASGDSQIIQATQIGPSIPISGSITEATNNASQMTCVQLPSGEYQIVPMGTSMSSMTDLKHL